MEEELTAKYSMVYKEKEAWPEKNDFLGKKNPQKSKN